MPKLVEWGRVASLLLFTILAWFALVWSVKAQTCTASFYDSGRRTANGESFHKSDPTTVAMPERRLMGHNFRITNLANGKAGTFRSNDIGPARWTHHCVDLTRGGARMLGFERQGITRVYIERLN